MVVKHKIIMDLARPSEMPRVDTVHKDQYTRQLELSLYANGEAWTIPEDASILISFIRSDGTGGSYDTLPSGSKAWLAENNVLTVELAPDVLASPGPAMMAVDLLRGSSKISTFTIMLYVRKTIFTRVGTLEDYIRINGFLPMPDTAEEGQYFKVSKVDENGGIVKLEAVTLPSIEEVLAQAKENGDFSGASAYEIAVENGYTGTEVEFGKALKQLTTGVWGSVIAQTVHLTRALTTDSGITINFNGNKLHGVSDPKEERDAVNKRYVDALANPYAVPDHWQDAVDEAVVKVKEYQDRGGRNCLSFAWFSDCHISPDDSAVNPGNTGKIVSKVMDSCAIPFALMCGDAARNDTDTLTDASSVTASLAAAEDVFAAIGYDRLLQTLGGHDCFWGTDFAEKLDANTLYGAVYRRQAEDHRRVFGGDGSCFYIDYPAAKLRFVVLNAYANSTAIDSIGFGADQLDWLEKTALGFDEEGWAVVLASHVPPYEAALTDGAALQSILAAFVEKGTAQIVGFFCGYAHKDQILLDTLPYPVVAITSDGDLAEDEAAEDRIVGSDNEHAVDFVTINRLTRTVFLTRLGAGEDRSFFY